MRIFGEAKFKLHKWHSNEPELEAVDYNGEPSFAKQQLGGSSTIEGCKLLGLKWDKVDDTLQVTFPSEPATLTKRGILAFPSQDLRSSWCRVASVVDRKVDLS